MNEEIFFIKKRGNYRVDVKQKDNDAGQADKAMDFVLDFLNKYGHEKMGVKEDFELERLGIEEIKITIFEEVK